MTQVCGSFRSVLHVFGLKLRLDLRSTRPRVQVAGRLGGTELLEEAGPTRMVIHVGKAVEGYREDFRASRSGGDRRQGFSRDLVDGRAGDA
jgi:hypothetical protein